MEPFTYESRKIGSVNIIFVEKKGGGWGGGRALIIYQAALKKGAIWHAYPYYAIYIKTSCKLSYNIFHSFNPILLVKNDFVSI